MTEIVRIFFDELDYKQYQRLVGYSGRESSRKNLQNDGPCIVKAKISGDNPPTYNGVEVEMYLYHETGRNGSIGVIQGLVKAVLSKEEL